jgi:hypothetical protein
MVRSYTKVFENKTLFEVSSYLETKENLLEYIRSLTAINAIEKDQVFASAPLKKKATSYTTETETTGSAVVPFFGKQHPFFMLKVQFGETNSSSSTSYVNSYISAKMGNSSQECSLKSEECPYQMVLRRTSRTCRRETVTFTPFTPTHRWTFLLGTTVQYTML